MKDYENSTWKYDIDSYERAKKIVKHLESLSQHPSSTSIKFWKDRVNAIADKYPQAKLERV